MFFGKLKKFVFCFLLSAQYTINFDQCREIGIFNSFVGEYFIVCVQPECNKF